ncbi:riboflavin synthase domain-like protein [Xylaria cf. heliscus]|nr:riboflavin synthase domain-like protein [Xylaria cf. heliscus]
MASEQDSAEVGSASAVPVERRKMLILYGSETGNSEESASDIEDIARRLRFRTFLEEMDGVELRDLLQYSLVIFVISTTGQGDLPKNARKFWKSLLRKRLPPNCLRQVNFTTFGLGDSSYFQYNWAARKLHKRLEQLGAVEFLPRGEADERHEDGIDGTFLPWCLTLRTYLEKHFPLPSGVSPISPGVQLPPKFTIELVKQNIAMDGNDEEVSGHDTVVAENTSQIENASCTGSMTTPLTATPDKKTFAERRAEYDVDNHGQKLDREAALFSHVDTTPRRLAMLKIKHEAEDRSQFKYAHARLSNETAENWPGGINIIDRPNVLKDAPTKYCLEDSAGQAEESAPAALLPIPESLVCKVEGNIRLTPSSHWQDVRKLSLRFYPQYGGSGGSRDTDDNDDNDDSVVVFPGDVAVVYPKNFPRDVQTLIDLMNWGEVADKPFQHVPQSTDIPHKVPRNCYPTTKSTLRGLLMNNYDITCIPRRTFFTQIAHYTEDPTHKERLREFADPGHSDEFWDYTSRPRRSILEVLQDFPSVRIPHQHIPSAFPVIRGREYSIASGGESCDGPKGPKIDLVIALVKYKTVLRKTRQGLCSRYISSLKPGTLINITIRPNNAPTATMDPRTPLLAIAPGTGIAPIRALLQYRGDSNYQQRSLLFYGGRNKEADFLFGNEWDKLAVKVVTAFSRDQPSKIYVQDRLLEHFEEVCDFLRSKAAICLCGSSGKMPEAVRLALYDCMVKGGMATSRDEAKEKLHKEFTFWEEVW